MRKNTQPILGNFQEDRKNLDLAIINKKSKY